MNQYFLYISSLFGTFIVIGSVFTILKNKGNKGNKIIYTWLVFGIIAQLTHIRMHLTRRNKDYNIASSVSTLNNSLKPPITLILCTMGQLTIIILYIFSRKFFYNKIFTDIAIFLILANIIARLVILIYNGGYTIKMLFYNSYDKYV